MENDTFKKLVDNGCAQQNASRQLIINGTAELRDPIICVEIERNDATTVPNDRIPTWVSGEQSVASAPATFQNLLACG